MQFDDVLGDCQPQPSAALLACDRRVGLLKFLENFGLIGFGDAGPGSRAPKP